MNQRTPHSAKEALEYLLAHGAVRYTSAGAVTHLPCSLVPWEAPGDFVSETEEITALYNDLYHRVAHDDDFLHTELERARAADEFVERLFQAKAHEKPGKPSLYLNRNDCMPAVDSQGLVWPKQVEMNLMASALGEASQAVWGMHRFLFQHQDVALKENRAGEGLTRGLAEGYKELNGDGVVLFLIPVGEVSVFDQRITESRLVEEYGVKTLRCTLEELGSEGELRQGDLYFRGYKVSIAYFRTGYAPTHYLGEESWNARRLIEESSAVSLPSARTQLANTKLIQLVLAKEDVLRRFMNPEQARRLVKSCVAFSKLDEEFTGPDGKTAPGREHGLQNPDDWVLKPHREGGGNNFFGADIVSRLQQMSEAESEAYILMEKIRQPVFESVRLVEGKAIPCRCVTELGFFARAFYAAADKPATFNVAQGYLLRTKDESMDEGLVLGGFSFLDTVKL
ncbi:MAG: hypothetical protein WC314_19850 [Vulcanimicrobiota bacterium]